MWPLWALIAAFSGAALLILVSGTALAGLADRLADRTGLGEAMTGALLLGISTSLPGITTSVIAGFDGYASLAVSNAMGGIAVQTAFLAVADLFWRRANLEHAGASPANLIQATVLGGLLALVLIMISGPEVTIGPVHVGTPILFAGYLFGIRLAAGMREAPMWRPTHTTETVEDIPDVAAQGESLGRLLLAFGFNAALVLVAGAVIARSAEGLIETTGISESLAGALFTAVSTSMPELVTTVTAVRRGALALAVGNIVGGNTFDVLFVCAADIAYTDGSIFHAVTVGEPLLVALAVLLNAILLVGLVRREKRGPAGIGLEGVLILVFYVGGIGLLAMS